MPEPPAAASLVLERVSLAAGGRTFLGPLDLAVPAGEIVTLMGPSGCGKSSLLALITGTLPPAFAASGRVLCHNRDLDGLPPEHRRVGILFQDDLLFPHLSVGENLAFGVPQNVRARSERQERVRAALAEAGLEGMGDRDPATLSGGQRQRVALMRTLLAEPQALLLDEPFARLDVPLRDRMRGFVFGHARQWGVPTLLVTHDPADAEAAGGRVVELAAPTGQTGPTATARSGPA